MTINWGTGHALVEQQYARRWICLGACLVGAMYLMFGACKDYKKVSPCTLSSHPCGMSTRSGRHPQPGWVRRFPRWLFNRGAPKRWERSAAIIGLPTGMLGPRPSAKLATKPVSWTASHTNSGNGSAPTFLPPVTFAPEATSANSLLARDWSAANAALSRLQSLSRERSWRRKALKPNASASPVCSRSRHSPA